MLALSTFSSCAIGNEVICSRDIWPSHCYGLTPVEPLRPRTIFHTDTIKRGKLWIPHTKKGGKKDRGFILLITFLLCQKSLQWEFCLYFFFSVCCYCFFSRIPTWGRTKAQKCLPHSQATHYKIASVGHSGCCILYGGVTMRMLAPCVQASMETCCSTKSAADLRETTRLLISGTEGSHPGGQSNLLLKLFSPWDALETGRLNYQGDGIWCSSRSPN